MGDLDPIRAPENGRYLRSLIIAVCAVLGLFLAASWWAGSIPRFFIAFVVSAAIGWAIAMLFRPRKRRPKGRRR